MPPVCPFLDMDKKGRMGGFLIAFVIMFECIKTKTPSPFPIPFGCSVLLTSEV